MSCHKLPWAAMSCHKLLWADFSSSYREWKVTFTIYMIKRKLGVRSFNAYNGRLFSSEEIDKLANFEKIINNNNIFSKKEKLEARCSRLKNYLICRFHSVPGWGLSTLNRWSEMNTAESTLRMYESLFRIQETCNRQAQVKKRDKLHHAFQSESMSKESIKSGKFASL